METSVTVLPPTPTADNPVATAGPTMLGPAPVTTLSSGDATNHVTNVIAPALATANKSITDQQAKLATDAATKAAAPVQTQQQQDAATGFHNPYGYDPTTGAQLNNPNAGAPTQPTSDIQALNNTPETGQMFAYQPDGTRVEIPIGSTAAQYGLSDTKPSSQQSLQSQGGISQAIPLDSGNQVAKLGNGTYATLDSQGNVLSTITADQFAQQSAGSNAYKLQLETQAKNEISGKLTQITNGTMPLSPWQQDQINNIKADYADLIAKQTIANANYEGGTKTYEGLTGMSQYSPGVAMGAVKAAVDEGISKIASLQSKMAADVGKMSLAFQQQNFDNLKTLYDEHQKNVDDAQNQIDKIQAAVAKAKDDQRTYELDVQKQADVKAKNAQDYKLAQAKDAVTAAHNKATEEVASATLALNKQKVGIEQSKANAYIDNLAAKTYATDIANKALSTTNGLSGINGDGTVNTANVAKILSSLPQGIGDAAKNILAYKTPLSDIKDAKTREVVRSAVLALNPNFDEKQYIVAKQYLSDYSSTRPTSVGGAKTALNAMSGHINELSQYIDKIDSSSSGGLNAFENAFQQHVGPFIGTGADTRTALGGLEGMKQVFSEENLKYLKGSAAGESAASRMEALFSGSLSKEEAQGAVKAMVQAINDKTNTLLDSQKSALGYLDSSHPIMYPQQAIQLDKLGAKMGVQAGSLDNVLSQTPEGQIYMLRQNPDGEKQYQGAKTTLNGILGKDPTADEILQAFPQLGVQRNAVPGAYPSVGSDVQAPPSDNTDFSSAIDNADTSNQ